MPTTKAEPAEPVTTCSFLGCGRARYCLGLCGKHYRQQARTGSPDARLKREDVRPLSASPRVSASCVARYEAEAKRRGVSLYQLVCETLEAGPLIVK